MKSQPPRAGNLFQDLPLRPAEELFQPLLERAGLRIERIVSFGHANPAQGWFDQDRDEWVLLLRGEAVLAFERGGDVHLVPGSYLHIPAHCRHRVTWTPAEVETVWLALHFGPSVPPAAAG